jgi:hypothetical protein
MRRPARRLFTLCPAASLVAWAVACVLWVRSYGDSDTLAWYENEWHGTAVRCRAFGVSADSGGAMFFTMNRRADFAGDEARLATFRANSPTFRGFHHHRLAPCGYPHMDPEYAGWRLLGFGYFAGTRNPPILSAADHDRFLVVPFWLAALLTGAVPAAWGWGQLRRNHRLQHGRCPACGYDLRATPGRCPECGTAAVAAPAAAEAPAAPPG